VSPGRSHPSSTATDAKARKTASAAGVRGSRGRLSRVPAVHRSVSRECAAARAGAAWTRTLPPVARGSGTVSHEAADAGRARSGTGLNEVEPSSPLLRGEPSPSPGRLSTAAGGSRCPLGGHAGIARARRSQPDRGEKVPTPLATTPRPAGTFGVHQRVSSATGSIHRAARERNANAGTAKLAVSAK
jgi:hypothetical protein